MNAEISEDSNEFLGGPKKVRANTLANKYQFELLKDENSSGSRNGNKTKDYSR